LVDRTSGAGDWLEEKICELSSKPCGGGSGTGSTPVDDTGGDNEEENQNDGDTSGGSGGGADFGVVQEDLSFFATVRYDKFPARVGVYVMDDETGEKLATFPRGSTDRSYAKRTRKLTSALQPGRQYLLVMEDGRGNGFCCGKGKGFVNLFAKNKNGKRVWNRKVFGKFKSKNIIRFTVPAL